MTEDDAQVLLARVNERVRTQWEELRKPQGAKPGERSFAWDFCLTDPLPASWPMTQPRLVFYAFAHGLDLRQPTGGETLGNVWAKVTTEGVEPQELVQLESALSIADRRGVRPLTGLELEALEPNPIRLLCSPLTDETAGLIRARYRLQLKLGNLPGPLRAFHPDFFGWLE